MTDREFRRMRTYNRLLFRYLERIPPGARVLDVGCGEHSLLLDLKDRKQIYVCGFDRLPKEVAGAGLDEYHVIDLNDPSVTLPDGAFDFVFCNHVLEHLQSFVLFERILTEKVRAGGTAYLAGPSERTVWLPSLRFRMEQGTPLNFYDDRTHVRPLTSMHLFETLSRTGFSSITVKRRRDKFILVIGVPKLVAGLIIGNRRRVVHTLWDFVGWEIQAVGTKEPR